MDGICQVCQKEEFKYTCPKCNIIYCSVACYKAPQHLKCSEEFYKSCIEEEVTTRVPNSREDMRKIYDILQRIRETDAGIPPESFADGLDTDEEQQSNVDSDDDIENGDEEQDIAERLQGIDINDSDEVWNRLTQNERQEFQNMIECGDIMKLLPDYKPWWAKRTNSKIIVLSTSQQTDLESKIPKICTNIAKFSTICSKTPSPCLHYNLWNILSAYASVVRFFNGEHLTNAAEAAAHLLNLSATLKYGTNFEDADDAIVSVEMEALTTHKTNEGGASTFNTVLIESREQLQNDARQLMSSRNYKLAALSDLKQLLLLAKQQMKVEKTQQADFQKLFAICSGSVELNKTKLNQLAKKMEFLLSYVNRDAEAV